MIVSSVFNAGVVSRISGNKMRLESKLHGTEQAILIWVSELVAARGETSHRKTLCEGTSI